MDAQPSTLLRACGRQLRSPWPQTAFAGQVHGAQPCVSSGCLGWVKNGSDDRQADVIAKATEVRLGPPRSRLRHCSNQCLA